MRALHVIQAGDRVRHNPRSFQWPWEDRCREGTVVEVGVPAPFNLPGTWAEIRFDDGETAVVRLDGPGFAEGPPVVQLVKARHGQTALFEDIAS